MIHEYALEPELVATWVDRHTGRYFVEHFGLGHPRIVSRYPKRWRKLVWDALKSSNDLERKRMEVVLEQVAETMVARHDFLWNAQAPWLENAEGEHARVPFHAILSRSNPRGHGQVLVADDLHAATPLWAGIRGRTVTRTASELAAAVKSMLRNANVVVFIDPYFRPERRRHREPLREFLRAVVDGRPGEGTPRIEVYCSAEDERDSLPSEQFFRSECQSRLPAIIPRGLSVDLVRLRQRDGGERLHNRYILTDIGGVTLGYGLDEGDPGASDDIQLLDRALYEERWRQYAGDTPAFDRPEPTVTVSGL